MPNEALQGKIDAIKKAPEADKAQVTAALNDLKQFLETTPDEISDDEKQQVADVLKNNMGKLQKHVESDEILSVTSELLSIAIVGTLRAQLEQMQQELNAPEEEETEDPFKDDAKPPKTRSRIGRGSAEVTKGSGRALDGAGEVLGGAYDVVEGAAVTTYEKTGEVLNRTYADWKKSMEKTPVIGGTFAVAAAAALALTAFAIYKAGKATAGFIKRNVIKSVVALTALGALVGVGFANRTGLRRKPRVTAYEEDPKDKNKPEKKDDDKLEKLNKANKPVSLADTEGVDIMKLTPPIIIDGKEVSFKITDEKTVISIDGKLFQLVGKMKTVGANILGFGGVDKIVEGADFEKDRKALASMRGGKDKFVLGLKGTFLRVPTTINADVTHEAMSALVKQLSSSPDNLTANIDVPLVFDTIDPRDERTVLRFKRIKATPEKNSQAA